MAVTKRKPLTTVGQMSNHSVRSLMSVVGKDALISLSMEVDMDLFLFVACGESDRIYYEVCDGKPGERDQGLIFDDLTEAVAAYDLVRRAGSWKDYLDTYPGAPIVEF